MNSLTKDLGITATQKALSRILDGFMTKRGVPKETREAITNSFEMMYEYIPYAIEQGENPSDGKVLAKFLANKGMHAAKYLGNNSIGCGLAIVDLLKSGAAAFEATNSPAALALPVPVLAWGLASLDLIEVGNSCEFAQDAYYHLFLKDSAHVRQRASAVVTVTLSPLK